MSWKMAMLKIIQQNGLHFRGKKEVMISHFLYFNMYKLEVHDGAHLMMRVDMQERILVFLMEQGKKMKKKLEQSSYKLFKEYV